MKHSESVAAIAKALVAAQGEIKSVPKDSVNPHFKNRYASLEAVTEAVRPVLTKNGLALIQGGGVPTSDEAGHVTAVSVETMLLHSPSGEWISGAVTMPLDKPTAQGVGSAVSYGRRYGLCSLLAIVTDEDDDGEHASAPRQSAPQASGNGTPRPASNRPAGEKVMPFGKTKGKKLSELSNSELDSAIAWCRKTDAAKFDDLISAMGQVMAARVGEDLPVLVEDEDDSLPF